MNKCFKSLAIVASVLTINLLYADVISLNDGTILEGDYIGKDNGIVMFRINGEIKAFPEADIAALIQEDQASSSNTPSASASNNAPTPAPASYSVPAGSRLVLNMLEDVDSSRHPVGHQFRAQLESALSVGGEIVIPIGTIVHGVISESEQSRRASGQSELSIEFTDILVNDQLIPIATGELSMQGENETRSTVRRAARGAVIGGLINGSDGARDGAAIAAGVSILTPGSSVNVSRGTILETELRTAINVQQ